MNTSGEQPDIERPETEISPPKYPHIDIPQPDSPAGPITTPEQPVPVRGAA